MAERTPSATAPQSTTSSSHPPYTTHATSIPDDSSTEYEPTPVHSPGGPQYEDLPPSYDFALDDARNGGTALDASQIEAHRVSANEGPDEPEVWEYRMRGEDAEGHQEHEEAPAYDGLTSNRQVAPPHEGLIPVQHVTGSQSIPVGRVGNLNSSSTSTTTRGSTVVDDPPHSIPTAGLGQARHEPAGSQGGHLGQAWGPFGAPGNGPFGASGHGPFGGPRNGPFGALGNGPFGPGRGSRGDSNARGHGRRGRGSRSSQDWVALGQNMGKWGEDFGRKMGNWGEQFGRQAGAMGKQFGQRSEQWASAYSAGGGGYNPPARPVPTAGPSTAEPSGPPQYDHPPSYDAPVGVPGQETGVSYRHLGANEYPPEKVPQSPSERPSAKSPGKLESKDYDVDDDDDGDSSISSDCSDSSSSSDSDDDDHDDAQATFLKRIDSINKAAESAASKGKKSREEIEHERGLAIAKVTREKEAADYRLVRKQARRTQKRDLRNKKRELTREYRQKKRELIEKSEGNGKGKGKAKKGTGWKELKREYKGKRKTLKRERMNANREWKRERRELRRGPKEGSVTRVPEQKVLKEES